MSEKVILELTREQAQAVMNATEFLARLEIGQFKEIVWHFIDRFHTDNGFHTRRREEADELADRLAKKIFGVNEYGRANVESKSTLHQRLWAIYTTIRHTTSWHDHPEGGITVIFDKPLEYGEEMPKCKVVSDNERKDV